MPAVDYGRRSQGGWMQGSDLRIALITVRPQIVYEDFNLDYHRLIREFARRRNIGAVLDTSFNLHGAPIVGSPTATLDVFERSRLRWLAIGNFLVHKN